METTPAAVAPPGYESNPLKLIKPAWVALQVNLKLVVIAILASVVLFGALGAFVAAAALSYNSHPTNFVQLLVSLALAVSIIGLVAVLISPFGIKLLLASVRGQQLTLRELFRVDKTTYWRTIGAGLLTALAVLGGIVLLVVPGFIFMAWFLFSSFVAMDEGLAPVEAMKRSRDLVRGHMTETFALLLLPTAVSVVGIVPILGALVSLAFTILYTFITPLRYVQLKDLKGSGQPAPALDRWNYAIIVVALIFGSVFQYNDINKSRIQPTNPTTNSSYTLSQ